MIYEKGTPWNKKMELRRVFLDLTQEQAAGQIGVPIGTYGRWERGEHKPMRVYRGMIAAALKIEEIELFY